VCIEGGGVSARAAADHHDVVHPRTVLSGS
jgi:predicted nicotinamide N-methyase